MEDHDIELNINVCGKKRRLSSDDESIESNLKDENHISNVIKNDNQISSKESTPRIVNKSTRSRRILSSDSDNNGFSDESSDNSIDSSQSQHTSSDTSSESSPNESSNETSDFSDKDSSVEIKEELIKSEERKVTKSRNRKVERKPTKRSKSNKTIENSSKTNNKTNKNNSNTQKKRSTKDKVSNSQNESSDEEESIAYVPRRDRDHKQILVAAILCRWWHALPDWPPPDTDYQSLLKERKLRLVEIDDWEDAPDIDENGYSKVFQLSNYTGVFRDSKGTAHDLRPLENKPCYSNLIKMDEDKLYKLLVTALENQIKTLEDNPQNHSKLINELKRELIDAQALLSRRSSKKK